MTKTKKRWWLLLGVAIVIVAVLFWWFAGRGNEKADGAMAVALGNLVQEVNVSGQVSPASSVELAFKQNGRVAQVLVRVGDQVAQGQTLAVLENNDEVRAVREAEIALAKARLELDKLISPVNKNVEADKLRKAYEDGLTEAAKVYGNIYGILDDLDRILFDEDLDTHSRRENLKYYVDVLKYYDLALQSLPANLTALYNRTLLNYRLAFDAYQEATRGDKNISPVNAIGLTTELVRDTLNLIKISRDLLQTFVNRSVADNWRADQQTLIESDLSKLSDYFDTVNGHWLVLVNVSNTINSQESTLTVSDLDVQAQNLEIRQKSSDLDKANSRLADTYLRASFAGVITKLEVEVGESVTANSAVASLISGDNLEIEAYVPETNIALLELGDTANVLLDAYGDTVTFPATVIAIDPAETVRDGVSTYKTTLRFNLTDPRVRSGMTANVQIQTANKSDVILLPSGLIQEENGQKFVWILNKNGERSKRLVTTGEASSNGELEIVSGLELGEVVVGQE